MKIEADGQPGDGGDVGDEEGDCWDGLGCGGENNSHRPRVVAEKTEQ